MKLLGHMLSLKNGYRLTGFVRGRAAHPLTGSLLFINFRILHGSRYYIVHIERDIVVFDRHPKVTVPCYGGTANFYVEYIIRESTSSNTT